MPFDGRAHGIGALIPPYHHHPGAPALGQGLAAALRHTYAAARAPRLLGQQSHEPLYRGIGAPRIVAGAYAGAARFYQVDRPAWATGVVVEVRALVPLVDGARIYERVQVTDGTDTDETILIDDLAGIEADGYRVLAPVLVPLSAVGAGPVDVLVDLNPSSTTTTLGWVVRVPLVTAWWVTHG